jgi:hypothetical protein
MKAPDQNAIQIAQLRSQVEYLAREVAALKAGLSTIGLVGVPVPQDYTATRARIVGLMREMKLIDEPENLGKITRGGKK